jgi:deoxyribonucleoside regulator
MMFQPRNQTVDEELKIKICRMYYLSDISKSEIANSLGISRFRVSRLIDQAWHEGIIQINIMEPISTSADLEEQLEKRFNLYHAIVVQPPDQSNQTIVTAIGRAAAERLLDLLKDGDILGITWGATVNEVVKALPARVAVKLDVVQITGGLNQMALDINPIDLVRRVAERYDAESHILYAPAIMRDQAARQALMEDDNIYKTIEMFERVNVALSGIGSFSSFTQSNLLKSGYIRPEEYTRLKDRRAVGDVFAHIYDIKGDICDPDFDKMIIGMNVAQLRKVHYSIGVAGGVQKSLAILGALRGQYINILVTDQNTALDILEKDEIFFA